MRRLLSKLISPLDSFGRRLVTSPRGRNLIARCVRKSNQARALYLKAGLKACGANVSFQLPVCLTHPWMIEIGDDVSFAAYVHVWGGGGVKIGNRVMIGSHTAISSVTHDYDAAVMTGTIIEKPIVIGDDVWISAHAMILPGVNVGTGAVIGAGCVVTKDVPARAIVVGIPGRVLRFRPPASAPVERKLSVS
jgi:maltose O-acetyltransferase